MLSLLVFIGEAVRDAFDPERRSTETDMGNAQNQAAPLLDIVNLEVTLQLAPIGSVQFAMSAFMAYGAATAIVGESGSGKSVTALSVMRLPPSRLQDLDSKAPFVLVGKSWSVRPSTRCAVSEETASA